MLANYSETGMVASLVMDHSKWCQYNMPTKYIAFYLSLYKIIPPFILNAIIKQLRKMENKRI